MTMTQDKPLTVGTVQTVKLAWVKNNPWQPRVALDPEQIKELADSIQAVGLLQRPTVRPVPIAGGKTSYELAFGHYRMAALRLLELEEYDLEVRELSDAEMAIIALTENKTRKDVTPIEAYRAWAKALQIDGLTVQDLASKLGLDRSTVSNNLRLLRLPQAILKYVESGELSAHGAREFLCLMGDETEHPTHFHQNIAEQVLEKLTKGTPDWRVSRVRYLITEAIVGESAQAWRRLFTGDSPGGGHMSPPLFDLEAFKTDNRINVHTIPADDWGGQWQTPSTGKLKKEGSKDWTCAASKWVNAQTRAKNAPSAPGASSPAKPAAAELSRTANVKTTLSKDPVLVRVSGETGTTAAKLLSADGGLKEEVAEMLGTRAAPVVITRSGFKVMVDERGLDSWELQQMGATSKPSYFPDIEECRKTCTIGATYGATAAGKPLYLWCLNAQHYAEKVDAGKAATIADLAVKAKELDGRDDATLGLLAEAGLPSLTHMLAASLLLAARFGRLEPQNVHWQERDDLSIWPGNTRRIFELLGADPEGARSIEALVSKVAALKEADAQELTLRLLAGKARGDEALAQFVPAAKAVAK